MSDRQHDLARLSVPPVGEVDTYLSYAGKPQESAILYVHGFGSGRGGEKAAALEAACQRHGLTFASFDFRGHGQSTGTLLELRGTGLLADLQAVQAHLAGRGIRRLGLVGSSMGGWASAWFAVRHPEAVASCVLIAPALNFIRARWATLTEPQRQHWRQTGRLRVRNEWVDTEIGYGLVEEIDRFPVEELASQWSRPLVIFHGMNDQTVPFSDSLDFIQRTAFPGIELRLFKSGDHRLSAIKEDMAETACRFFLAHR